MAGKRVDKTEAATEGDSKPAAAADRVAIRPASCRAYARARVAEAMPELLNSLLEEAGKGSLPHLKVLVQLSGFDTGEVVAPKKGRSKGKSLQTVLKERWEQDRREREADRAEQERARQDGTDDSGRRLDEG